MREKPDAAALVAGDTDEALAFYRNRLGLPLPRSDEIPASSELKRQASIPVDTGVHFCGPSAGLRIDRPHIARLGGAFRRGRIGGPRLLNLRLCRGPGKNPDSLDTDGPALQT